AILFIFAWVGWKLNYKRIKIKIKIKIVFSFYFKKNLFSYIYIYIYKSLNTIFFLNKIIIYNLIFYIL
ncbi:MAG: hypothetical protein N7Q72_04775, partial [Spiroplasma sp. Tabriz.8]|nr:hypothetical protein [Spiroplasma sp. Tabriz.8]